MGYPVEYIMSGLQHLTFDQSKILCCIMLIIWPPTPQKLALILSLGWPQFFSFGERDGDNLFRARANPDSTTELPNHTSISHTIYHQIPVPSYSKYCHEEVKFGSQHLLRFPQCFLPFPKQI